MGTTGLLIAAICIAAALVVVIVAFGAYVMRTKGLSFSDVFRRKARPRHRIDRTHDVKPTVHRMPAYAWDDRKPPSYSQSVPLPRRPEPAATRIPESASRPARPSTPPGFKSPSNTSFLDDASPPRNSSRLSHHSRQPSSTTLPLGRQQTHASRALHPFRLGQDDAPRENSFYRSRESSVSSRSDDGGRRSRANSVDAPRAGGTSFFAAEEDTLAAMPNPPLPGFVDAPRAGGTSFFAAEEDTLAAMPNLPLPGLGSGFQFMANRPGPASLSRGLTLSSQSSTMLSPLPLASPFDASFGLGGEHQQSTASTARFRSVDSWVGQQTSRIESTEFRNQPHFSFQQHGAGLGQVDEGQAGWRGDETAPPDGPVGLHGDDSSGAAPHHRRQNTNHSDATVFRVHPGSEIKIPRGSLVPLDANMVPSAL